VPAAIRYCPTPAGRVAYAVAGSGPPLLCDVGWVSHVHRQPELFSFGPFMAGLGERFTVIRYDCEDGAAIPGSAACRCAQEVREILPEPSL
jgi:hypothetical protein